MRQLNLFLFFLLLSLFVTVTPCHSQSKYATEKQVKLYDSLQGYMKQHRDYFLAEAKTWNGTKSVEIMTDILDNNLDAVCEKQQLTTPQDIACLLMNMMVWVDIHKKKVGAPNPG